MAPVKVLGKTVAVEILTERFRIEGNIFIPTSQLGAYNERLSDFLNDGERTFIAVTDVTLSHLVGNEILWNGNFLAVNKSRITLVRALKE